MKSPEQERFIIVGDPATNGQAYETSERPNQLRSLIISRERDEKWLADFGLDADEETLQKLQDLVDIDTEDLRTDQSKRSESVQARYDFYDMIGQPYTPKTLVRSSSRNIRSKRQDRVPTIAPLKTTIGALRYLTDAGIHTQKILNAESSFTSSKQALREKMDSLTELGLNAVKIVNASPVLLNLSKAYVKEKADNLTALGVHVVEAVNRYPALLNYDKASLKEKIDNLNNLGIDAIKAFNTYPSLAGNAPARVRTTVYTLMKFGLWEDSARGEGYRTRINNGRYLNILTMPVESLMAYISLPESSSKNIVNNARSFMKARGLDTAQKRKAYVIEDLKNGGELYQKLGYVALVYAGYQKIDDQIDWSQ